MRRFTILFTLAILFSSCKSLHFSAIPSGSKLQEKLPPLEPEFDLRSFGNQYADLYGLPGAILTGRAPSAATVVDNIAQEHIIAEDTKRIFSREILHNISEPVGETKGYAVCRQGIRSKGVKSFINPLVSILTLGIPNLFGFKYADFVDELEVVVDIYDLEDKVIASYSGFGRGEARVSLYKGYAGRDARRLAHGIAFVNAMEDIKAQMLSDSGQIAAVLDK